MLCQCTQPRVASSTSSTVRHGPWPGPRMQLGLVEPVDRLGQRVVVAVADEPIEGTCAELGEAFAVAHAGELAAGIGVGDEAVEAGAA